MTESLAQQIERLERSIQLLEAQRAVLGDAIQPAIEASRQQLAALKAQAQVPAAPVEERRLVTILFSDIVGSTALAEKMDPEEWRRVVAALHDAAGSIIDAHQGQVVQYLGDGLLALFGAQASSERDPENAIRAALRVQTEIANRKWEVGGEGETQELKLRVGIHTGAVVVGELGAASHREFTATGDAMNLAARLQSAAPPGGVLISDDTYRYVRGVFDLTPQPPLTVKGKREPLQTYLVRRAKPRAFRMPTRGVRGVYSRTVGRDAERAQLQAAYLDAFENGRVVWAQLLGEPGVGKSRLLQDLDDWTELREESIWVFKARAFPGDATQAFAQVRRLWFERFQIAEDAPLAQAEAKWVRQFHALWGAEDEDATERAHALGLMVGLTFADSPYIGAMRSDPTQVKGRGLVVSRELLQRLRRAAVVKLLLEDVQWADESSWEWLMQVVVEGAGASRSEDAAQEEKLNGVFVLAAARPEWETPKELARHAEQRHPLPHKASPADAAIESSPAAQKDNVRYIEIPLAPLTDSATRELALELLQKVEGVPDEIVELIIERAEGVPYFVEELVNWFLDRGIIDHTTEPWRFVQGRLRESPLPTTLQHLLLTRLSNLSDAERAALQRGAIFGRNFWTGGIIALGAPEGAEVLAHLQPRGFVVPQPESSLEGEREWSFYHNLLRQVTYESVLKRERAALHKAAAAWLEEQARRAGRLEEFAGLLAEHCEQAGEWSAAADWYIQAGERAFRQGALREARNYLDRALELLPPVERERRWRALAKRVHLLRIGGEMQGWAADIEVMDEIARDGGNDEWLAELWIQRSWYAGNINDYPRALRAGDEALAAARRAGNLSLELNILSGKVFALGRLHQFDAARALADTLIERARAHDDPETLALALSRTAIVYTDLGDRVGEAHVLGNLGYTYLTIGLYKLGRATLEHALQVNNAIGARYARIYNLLNLGLAYFRLGDGSKARRVLEEGIEECARTSDRFGRGGGLSYLSLELERAGDFAGAALRAREAADLFAGIPLRAFEINAHAVLARCALAQGQLETTRQEAQTVWEYLNKEGTEGLEFSVWDFLTCADVFDALGDATASRAAVEAGYRELTALANRITNDEWRRTFLENVPENRAMTEMYERVTGGE